MHASTSPSTRTVVFTGTHDCPSELHRHPQCSKTMDTILQGMDGVICYLDDILMSGKSEAEHLANLNRVLQKLKEHGLRIKKDKCAFENECPVSGAPY